MERLQGCLVRELEKCQDPTPGNIVDSLFNFIIKVTPCNNLLSKARADASIAEEPLDKSSASMFETRFLIVAVGVLTFMGIFN